MIHFKSLRKTFFSEKNTSKGLFLKRICHADNVCRKSVKQSALIARVLLVLECHKCPTALSSQVAEHPPSARMLSACLEYFSAL